jgi:hypothetical protein
MFDPEIRLQTITKQEAMIRNDIQEHIIESRGGIKKNYQISHKRNSSSLLNLWINLPELTSSVVLRDTSNKALIL